MKYRRKSLVEAIQYHGDFTKEIGDFLVETPLTRVDGKLVILTGLNGDVIVSDGDWIIRDRTNVYTLKNDRFLATYEPAT